MNFDFLKYQTLTLFGKKYQADELVKLAINKIKDPQIEPWERQIFWFILDWLNPSSSIKVKTSGSTGAAKTIKFEKDQMVGSAVATARFFEFSAKDAVLLALNMSYIAAKMMIVRSFVSSLDLYYVKPSSDPFKNTLFPKLAFVPLVPFQLKSIFRSLKSLETLRTISTILVGGAVIEPELQLLIKKESNAYYGSFGMAETLTHFALKRINGVECTSGYKTLEGVKIKQDENKCLQIMVPWISSDFISTRDIVDLLNADSFIWKGRLDYLINSGGIKLNPESIETKLAASIAFPYFISSLPDPMLGEKTVLFVESTSIFDSWFDVFDHELDKYERPKEIYAIPKFVYTSSNKINRKETINLFLARNSN